MDFSPGIVLLRSHWKVVATASLIAACLAYAISFLLSPQYSATVHVLVRASSSGVLNSSGQTISQQPTVLDSSLTTSLAETDSGIVTSRAMAERVVADLRLDTKKPDPSLVEQVRDGIKRVYNVTKSLLIYGMYKEPSAHDGAVDQTQRSLQAAQIKESYIVEIKASASDAKLAAAIADSAAKNLVAMSKERYQADAATYRDFLKQEVDKAQAAAEDAQARVSKFKNDNNLTDIDEALKLSADNQQQLQQQLQQTDVDLAAARARSASLVQGRDTQTHTSSTSSTVTTGRSSTTVNNTTNNPVYGDLATQAAVAEASVASLQARHDALTTLLAPTPTSQLPTEEAQLRQLEIHVASANAQYQSLQKTFQQQVLNAAGGNVEVSGVDQAGVPLYPDKPLRYLFLLVGALLGLVGGAGLAAWMDRPLRVRSEDRAIAGGGQVLQPAFTVPVADSSRSSSLSKRRRTVSIKGND